MPTLNVQATCDAGERFTSVSANWPGSVRDSRIWKNSDVGKFMANSGTDAVLLGDEGYGIAPWLMTPYKDPVLQHERAFNNLHKKERVIIERCFGQLKRRFPILQGRVRLQLKNVPRVVIACFVLHNISKYLNDPDDFLEFSEEPVDDGPENFNDARKRQRRQEKRQRLAQVVLQMTNN